MTETTEATGADVPGVVPEAAEAPAASAKRWYVVHAYSGMEKSVARHCRSASTVRACRAFRPDPGAHRGSGRNQGRPEVHQRTPLLSRLRAGRDGNDRQDLAPGQDHPKVTGFVGGNGEPPDADLRRRKSTRSCRRCRRATRSRGPRCCSRWAKWCASRTVRSPTSTAMSRKSTTRRTSCGYRSRFSAAPTPVELDFGQVEKV